MRFIWVIIMKNDIYFNPKKYLPYQRNFIMVSSERTIGKTYSTQKFFLERALTKQERFVYIVRYADEIQNGVFQDAFAKVIDEQFPDYKFKFIKNKMFLCPEGEDEEKILIGYCAAISSANKTKKVNYPRCRWGLFDEYIVEETKRSEYVGGWEEPTLLLKLYHTIDREQDYLTLFMLANSIEFYNPYHLHPAFHVGRINKGEIWKSDNVLYTIAEASQSLKEKKANSKFLKMIEGTDYGKYAKDGYFINDNDSFIGKRPFTSVLKFNFDVNGCTFGVWMDRDTSKIYVDDVYDKNFTKWFTFDKNKHSEGKILVKGREAFLCKWLGDNCKKGNVIWTNMEVKGKSMDAIAKMM